MSKTNVRAAERVSVLKIGGVLYRVEFVDRLIADDGSTKLNGCIRHIECVVQIENLADEQMQKITVLHEILHGILNQAGIEEEHEKIIDIFGYGLFGVIRDNLELMDWIRGWKEAVAV